MQPLINDDEVESLSQLLMIINNAGTSSFNEFEMLKRGFMLVLPISNF